MLDPDDLRERPSWRAIAATVTGALLVLAAIVLATTGADTLLWAPPTPHAPVERHPLTAADRPDREEPSVTVAAPELVSADRDAAALARRREAAHRAACYATRHAAEAARAESRAARAACAVARETART